MSLNPDQAFFMLAHFLLNYLAFDDLSSQPLQYSFRLYCFGCFSKKSRFVSSSFYFALYSFQGARPVCSERVISYQKRPLSTTPVFSIFSYFLLCFHISICPYPYFYLFFILSLFFSVFLVFSFCIFYMQHSFLNFPHKSRNHPKTGNNPCFVLPAHLAYNALTIFKIFLQIQQKRRFRVSSYYIDM